MGGKGPVRIEADVGLAKDQFLRQSALDDGELGGQEILDDVERQDAAVFVMIKNCLVRDLDVPFQQTLGQRDLLASKGDDFGILPVERSGKVDRQVVAQAALGKGMAVAVGDLSAWRRNCQCVGAGLILGLPCWLGIFDRARVVNGDLLSHQHEGDGQQGLQKSELHSAGKIPFFPPDSIGKCDCAGHPPFS